MGSVCSRVLLLSVDMFWGLTTFPKVRRANPLPEGRASSNDNHDCGIPRWPAFLDAQRAKQTHIQYGPLGHEYAAQYQRCNCSKLHRVIIEFIYFLHNKPSKIGPQVLPIRTLCLFLFGSLFLCSPHHSRWSAAPNARCYGGQELPVICVGASSGPLPTAPSVHPRFTGGAQAAA